MPTKCTITDCPQPAVRVPDKTQSTSRMFTEESQTIGTPVYPFKVRVDQLCFYHKKKSENLFDRSSEEVKIFNGYR